jgi:hypothetical protein
MYGKIVEKYNHDFLFASILLLTLVISSFCVGNAHAQILRTKKPDPKMPSVYLSYDSQVRKDSRCPQESGDQIILQLHNNTSDYINIYANFSVDLADTIIDEKSVKLLDGSNAKTLRTGSEVDACFDVEGIYDRRSDQKHVRFTVPKRDDYACTCSFISDLKSTPWPQRVGYWIEPGEFVKFAVPRKFLGRNMKVYTEFNYLWEFEKGELRDNEPRHRVYFYYSDMPNYVP